MFNDCSAITISVACALIIALNRHYDRFWLLIDNTSYKANSPFFSLTVRKGNFFAVADLGSSGQVLFLLP